MSAFNKQKLIEFRREMHMFPESGFLQFETQKRILNYLLRIGIKQENIKVCAKTGLVVDIYGKSEPIGQSTQIAFRADIDALIMTEENQDIQYISKTNCAHMCGHDGHTTCLLGFASLFLDQIDQIPSNQSVRLLFQPSEEQSESGAKAMIEDGCLEGVDEVYGHHNWPTHKVGYCMVMQGEVMAQYTCILVQFFGKGGHGSEPQKCIDPVQSAVDFHVEFKEIVKKYQSLGRKFVCTLPLFHVGQAFNAIASEGQIGGSLRSLEVGFSEILKKETIELLERLVQKTGINYHLKWDTNSPCVQNSEKEAKAVKEVAQNFFGQENVGNGVMPVLASEDYGFFLEQKPGVFFFLGSAKNQNSPMLHNSSYDWNEDLLEPASQFTLELALSRLGISK